MPTRTPRPESRARVPDFAARVIAWQRTHGRHDLPWQNTRDPYRIWLSEIMLQQTQVAAVIGYYARFLARFPDLPALAAASVDEVLALWSGLGYYSRARNLHACAQRLMAEHGGNFPSDPEALAQLPGIGRSTAAAIAAFAFGARAAILDGNVKRVFARHFGVEGWPNTPAIERALWQRAQDLLPDGAPADISAYTQGLMDLGATLCTRSRPRCTDCPLAATCVALRTGRTAELPAARPKKAVPTRHAHLLVTLCADEVLVEKRPPVGIWGGLWSLPQFDDAAALQAHAASLGTSAPQPWPERRHAFTHFTLMFTPHVARLTPRQASAQAPGRMWLPLADRTGAALPTPIRRLLDDLAAQD